MKKYPTILERKSISEPTIKNMTGKQKYNRCLWKGFIFVYFYAVRIYKRLGCRPPSRMSKSFHFHSVLTTKKKNMYGKVLYLGHIVLQSWCSFPIPVFCHDWTQCLVYHIPPLAFWYLQQMCILPHTTKWRLLDKSCNLLILTVKRTTSLFFILSTY